LLWLRELSRPVFHAGFAGDTLENANFETDTANASTSVLFLEEGNVKQCIDDLRAGKLRKVSNNTNQPATRVVDLWMFSSSISHPP
jgi:hypothetical protein